MKRDKTGKLGSGPTLQYQHSTSFLGDGIIGDQLSCLRGKTRHKVTTDASCNAHFRFIIYLNRV